MKVKELQFARNFLLHESKLDLSKALSLLNIEVEVRDDGEPDTAVSRGNTIIMNQPSSVTRFLFNVLYHLMRDYVNEGIYRDKLSLILLYACKDYVYSDYDPAKAESVPVLVSFKKLALPLMILEDLVEPLAGKSKTMPLMFIGSNALDVCEVITDSYKFSKKYKLPLQAVSTHDYPFLVVNTNIHNDAAKNSDILTRILNYSYGEAKTDKIIRKILLSESDMGRNLMAIVKVLKGDPFFLLDFLKYFECNVTLSREEEVLVAEARDRIIGNDTYLKKHIRLAQQGRYTPEIYKQWHQWSMVQGLIEKELGPMRGSIWPTTESVKPFEDLHREMEVKRAKEKGKTQLNFEELLELAREWYDHKAVQPGQLYEKLLMENRVWKA